jgi:hypothetical protein
VKSKVAIIKLLITPEHVIIVILVVLVILVLVNLVFLVIIVVVENRLMIGYLVRKYRQLVIICSTKNCC